MFFKSIVFSLMLLFGTGAINTALNAKQPVAVAIEETYTVHELVDGVWWAFVYNSDGVLINSYPDPDY